MTPAQFRTLLEGLADGWSRRDYETVAAAFAEDVHYADPMRYTIQGRARLLEFFRDDEGYLQSTVWRTVVFDESQQIGAAEYTYRGTHRFHGTVWIRLAGDLITHWREYQHVDYRPWQEFAGATAW